MKWAAALLGSVLLLARLVAAQPEILHPPGSAAPVEGLPILLEFGGTGSNDDAFTSGECVEVFTDPVCVGGTNAGGACVGASACPGGTCGLKKLRSAGDACGTGSGTPGPTVTPFACATGYAVQVVGATPGCVLLPTPDGAGAGAAATQTPWSCGAGNGARGMGGTPECFVVPTPDGSVATVTPGGGTPQPIATSTSAPGSADGFARVDHVHHLADGAIGPAKLSAAVPTPLPTPTALAFVNQANSFTGTNEFVNNVDLTHPSRLALDATGCSGAACSKVILRDNEGNAAIVFTASTPGLWSATGTGINRANDLVCTGCVDVSDLGFATPTPVPTATPTVTVTITPVACATDALGRGGMIGAHPEQCGVPVATITATPTATVTATAVACAANSYDAVIGPDVGGTCVPAVTPVYYVTPTPIATPGSNPTMAAGQAYWADGYAGIVSEGATADTIEGRLAFPDWQSSDKTLTFPDETGTICTTGSVCSGYFGTGDTVQPTQLNRLAANNQMRYFGTSDQVSLQYQSTLDRFMVDGEKSYFPKGAEMGSTPTPTATATATGVTPTPTGATVTPTPTPTPDLFVNILSVRDLQIRDTGSNITLQPLSRAGSSAVTTTLKGVDAIADAIRAPSANLTGGPLALTGGAASGLTTGGDVTLTSGNGFNGSNISLQSNPSFSGSLTASGRVLVKGHISTQSIGIAPTLSSCGTGSSVTGNDHNGTITVGTGATACTLTFGRGWANTPQCFANDRTAVLVVRATPTTTTVVFDTATAGNIASDTIDYWCVGRE